jgi:hypothetical protein
MAGQVYKAATRVQALDQALEAAFQVAELARDIDVATIQMREMLRYGRKLRVLEAPGKGYGVFVRDRATVPCGTLLGAYVSTVSLCSEAETGDFQMQCVDWPGFQWPDGRKQRLTLNGNVGYRGVAFDGAASRFNHTCTRPTVRGRWRRFGTVSVLEFQALDDLVGGTELVYNYNGGSQDAYAVSAQRAELMSGAGAGRAYVPCRCNGPGRCPYNRFVPAGDRA